MEFSGAVATAYAEHRRGYPPPVVDLLVDALGLPRGASVLDLGCGTGQLTVPLAGRYARVIGADPSPDMLALARSRAGGAPVAWLLADDGDVTRLPLLADLDAVTIAQAIHLLDRMPLFEALAGLMTPRARIAIVANGSRSGCATCRGPGRSTRTSGRGWARAPLSVRHGREEPRALPAELAAAGFAPVRGRPRLPRPIRSRG
jgi:SAM-dependent methyltransferase